LLERGYQVTYAEYSGAHDYINWRRTFADGLLAVLGDRVS
jgi:enterochelin esterase-like enzyme